MKKFFVSALLLASISGSAKSLPDTVAMTIGDKPVSISEFFYSAEKNGENDLSDEKKLKDFVQLFENFKLKVADAESQQMDKTKDFEEELNKYRSELIASYLSDKAAEEQTIEAEYSRMNEVLDLSHILLFLPEKTVGKDTVSVYQRALEIRQRLQNGEDFETVGKELMQEDPKHIGYERVRGFYPMRTVKAFEDAVYNMPEGELSMPIRTKLGFHIVKLHQRIPNPGRVQVAHILLPFTQDSVKLSEVQVKEQADSIYHQILSGSDFGELAARFSADKATAAKQGVLPVFGLGEMVQDFEKEAFALQNPGDVSQPFKTQFGYHIIKLIKKLNKPSLNEIKKSWHRKMAQGEWNFALYKGFDDRMKKEYNYTFYPEAYAELEQLCYDHFPTDKAFFEKAQSMEKTLARMDTVNFTQSDFAIYLQRCPFSVKTYSGDFMQEVYALFVREILTNMERKNLTKKHPEFNLLINEYRDGILLFAISNEKVWNKPADEQKEIEEAWLKELRSKYSITVNWKALKNAAKNK